MTELIIEYSIYKIVCKDMAITDLYVGSTKDIKTREAVHKSDCRSPNSGRYNLRIYKFIREHGGYENWEMVVLETIMCNRVQAKVYERAYSESLMAKLNTNVPSRTQQEWSHTNYANNCERIKMCVRQYQELNKEKIALHQKEYYLKNRLRILETVKRYQALNKDKIKERNLKK
jgi:hypothetical protein